jgi:hypothetical protein
VTQASFGDVAWVRTRVESRASNNMFLHLNLNHTTAVRVAGLLGERGWELATHSTLTGGHEYWTFKRELSEG